MPTLVDTLKFILLFLCGAGFYATWYLLLNNGTTEHLAHIRDVGPRLLPGTKESIKTSYTGIAAIDYQLTVLDLFFWEMVDGSRPEASLFCYHFAGQVFSGWGLLLLESLRSGNSWRAISFLAIWGIAIQNLAYAVIVPLFLISHLSTSPIVRSTTAVQFSLNVSDTFSIPIALTFGYALPTVLMSLPSPSILDFSTKQAFMACWQFFPLWVSVLRPIVAYLVSFISDRMATERHPEPTQKASLKALRSLYVILITAAGVSQISTLSIIAVSELYPSLFAPEYVGVMSLSRVFLPQAITTSAKMPSIGDGAFMLLQYDECIGSLSIALWAAVLLVQAHENQQRPVRYATLIIYGFFMIALTGPLGFAVACIWARDELVHGTHVELDKKSQ